MPFERLAQSARSDRADRGDSVPPPSNTGVVAEKISPPLIDYLRYSVAWELGVAGSVPDGRLLLGGERQLTPLRHYDSVYPLLVGRVDWHSKCVSQKILVTFSGGDCRVLEDMGLLEACISHGLYADGGRLTRLDIAYDVYEDIDLYAVVEDIRQGRAETAGQSVSVVGGWHGGRDAGVTVYLGSRSSERFMRIYDKGRKEGFDCGGWVRVELELKGEAARRAGKEIVVNGMSCCGDIVLDYARLPYPWYEAIQAGGRAFVSPFEERDNDRVLWYRRQVFPSIERDLRGGGPIGALLRGQIAEWAGWDDEGVTHSSVPSYKRLAGVRVLVDSGVFPMAFRIPLEGMTSAGFDGLMLRLGWLWDGSERRWYRA